MEKIVKDEYLGVISESLIKILIPLTFVLVMLDYVKDGVAHGFWIQGTSLVILLIFQFSKFSKCHRNRVYFLVFISLYHLPLKYVSIGQVISPTLMWFMILPVMASIFYNSKTSWIVFGLMVIEVSVAVLVIKSNGLSSFPLEPFDPLEFRTLFGWIIISSTLNYLVNYIEESRSKLFYEMQMKQEKNAQAERFAALGEMAGAIAHEINNPLQLIHGQVYRLTNTLEEKNINDKDIYETLSKLSNTTNRLGRIIKTMSNVVKIKDKNCEVSNIGEAIMMAITVVERSYANHSIDLNYNKSEFDVSALCHKGLLTQSLINLLKNAQDFASVNEKKWVSISIENQESHYSLFISDSGKGIEDHIIKNMFDPFFTSTDLNNSLGFGLSVAKANIESMSGELGYLLKNGHTTFEIKLKKEASLIPSLV